jgi:DNA repair exonuclease SbcCD ATPase subunit
MPLSTRLFDDWTEEDKPAEAPLNTSPTSPNHVTKCKSADSGGNLWSALMPGETTPLTQSVEARRRLEKLLNKRDERVKRSQKLASQFAELNHYLSIADKVTSALDQLTDNLLKQLLGIVEQKLTIAVQEILDQPLAFKAKVEFQRMATSVEFWIERDGQEEDILRGQGGSVANELSVGLRMFALATLDPEHHRPFLVLDEQDCWLRPDLVPRLVKIVHQAARELGFQVIMISHHDVALFEQYADKIFQFIPGPPGSVQVREVVSAAQHPDAAY